MRPPGRFGDPVPPAAGKDERHGPLQADPVALRDEYRLDPVARPEDGADLPVLMDQPRPIPPLLTHRCMRADEARLGAADRGPIEDQPQVGGEADPPGVGDPLAVEEDEIGRLVQLREGRDQRRSLPEGEKPGDVGERDAGREGRLLREG